ncbi:TIGR02301 family protein [Rhizobium rhizosphaerae]|uniref:TIGR02301 family protein n=1 Tax=Xaviernesmea rhizosphaerae TaxID=1672749 RepID=A0ABX3PCG8_9HYPH|nr:TIGR02301 family protein [Xaviernesmea rhizosphaerae]
MPATAQLTEVQTKAPGAARQENTAPSGAPSSGAQTAAPATPQSQPAAYDPRLMRLAEILGSVHYLRTLCASPDAGDWRQSMEALIAQEARNEEERRTRLTAAFNRGYRSFASVYTQCTAAAVEAERQYRAEGATLAAEIVARFGN